MRAKLFIAVFLLSIFSCTERDFDYFGVFREAGPEQIKARGWLKTALEIQRDGLGTHFSNPGYPYNTGLWACDIPKGGNPIAKGWWPYEQSGYLVDGLFRCGIFIDDDTLINLGKDNCVYVLEHPRKGGMIGPEKLGTNQWAISVFSRAMMAYYSLTRDNSVIDLYNSHFSSLPDSLETRQTCIIESMCKVYSYIKDKNLLHKAVKIWDDFSTSSEERSGCFYYKKMIDSSTIDLHGVTAAEVAKQPAILYLYTGDRKYLDEVNGFFSSIERDHQLVDGIPSSSEQLSGRQSVSLHETCDISDFLWSYGYMMMATGSAKWGDKMESALVNAAFGAIGKDFKTHQYFSSPNQLYATHTSSIAPYGDEGLFRQAYRPGFDTECCSGNVHRMLPAFVSRCWMLPPDNIGAVAALLAPSEFSFALGKNRIQIEETTDYPYQGNVSFAITMDKPARFPFYIRIPGWAEGTELSVNGEAPLKVSAGEFYVLNRKFRNGDRIMLNIPLRPRFEYTEDKNAVSVFLGPVLYSEKIEEAAEQVVDGFKTTEDYPAWNLRPASKWNYALDVVKDIFVDTSTVPYTLKASALEIPSWKDDGYHTPPLPEPGFQLSRVSKKIELIPSGCARLRMSILPVAPSYSDIVFETKQKAEKLLATWAEGLLSLRVDNPCDSTIAGNFLCPACGALHGRIIDIAWPMTWLWDRTGDKRYLDAADNAVRWGKCNMQMSDGSYLNDPNHLWRGITVFSQTSLARALLHFGDKLPVELRNEWRFIFDLQTEYIYRWMADPAMVVNVNYRAAFPLAMELAYKLTGAQKYHNAAKVQADRVKECIAEDGLLFGESKPMDILSKKGFRSVDIGYNVEESLPSMLEYAEMVGDGNLLSILINSAKEHLDFILPDGAIDNSFGCRNCKWTYWGSRTSDGILPMLSTLARNGVPEAMHAADLTLDLYSRLTDSRGLLTGGLYYTEAGEPPCIHHTFCHMKSLPRWIDTDFGNDIINEPQCLLSEKSFGHKSYPSCGIHIFGVGPWRATFSCYDYTFSGQKAHSTGGGSMTLLYHKNAGLLSAATMGRYSIVESMNMQEQRKDLATLCFTPRIQNGKYWSVYDDNASLVIRSDNEVFVSGHLTDEKDSSKGGKFNIAYKFSDKCLTISLWCSNDSEYVLPLISSPYDLINRLENRIVITKSSGKVEIETDSEINRIQTKRPDRLAFNPIAGLMANYFVIALPSGKTSEIKLYFEK